MDILDLIFPKKCVFCGEKGSYFCDDCLKKIRKAELVCPECEKPEPFGQTHQNCWRRRGIDGLFSFFVYEGPIRGLIHKWKYGLVRGVEKELFEVLKESWERREEERLVLEKYILEERPVVVPVPLFWYKENFRGFNQSALFGKWLANKFNLNFSDKIVVRKKNVLSQTKLGKEERRKNVQGIFAVLEEIGEGKFLLVDDVWTTGATMKEVTSLLKESGGAKVWGVTIAR